MLTKLDLVIQEATKAAILDFVMEKCEDLHSGYCVVKNRGADETTPDMKLRQDQESALSQEPWVQSPSESVGDRSIPEGCSRRAPMAQAIVISRAERTWMST